MPVALPFFALVSALAYLVTVMEPFLVVLITGLPVVADATQGTTVSTMVSISKRDTIFLILDFKVTIVVSSFFLFQDWFLEARWGCLPRVGVSSDGCR